MARKKTETAQAVRSIRRILGLSQPEFGLLMSISAVTVRRWERVGPVLTEQIIRRMHDIGLNPLFPFGIGNMCAEGCGLESAATKAHRMLNEIRRAAA